MVIHVNSPKHTPKHRVTTVQSFINNIHLTKYHEISWNVINEQEPLMRLMDSHNKINYLPVNSIWFLDSLIGLTFHKVVPPSYVCWFIIPWKLVRYITNKNPSEIGVINAPTERGHRGRGHHPVLLFFFQHHHIPIKWLVYTLWKPLLISLWTTMNHY